MVRAKAEAISGVWKDVLHSASLWHIHSVLILQTEKMQPLQRWKAEMKILISRAASNCCFTISIYSCFLLDHERGSVRSLWEIRPRAPFGDFGEVLANGQRF